MFFFSWKLYLFLCDRSILLFTASAVRIPSPLMSSRHEPWGARDGAADLPVSEYPHPGLVCCFPHTGVCIAGQSGSICPWKVPGKISAGKCFCRGRQFLSALSFKESTSAFSSPTELFQKAPLKEICLFPVYLHVHLWALLILTNSGSNEGVRNLLLLASK